MDATDTGLTRTSSSHTAAAAAAAAAITSGPGHLYHAHQRLPDIPPCLIHSSSSHTVTVKMVVVLHRHLAHSCVLLVLARGPCAATGEGADA